MPEITNQVLALKAGTTIPPHGFPFMDSFGRFRLSVRDCAHCQAPNQLCVVYSTRMELPLKLGAESTILKKVQNPICITNGCYGKLHRQVTHIVVKMESRR
jgi:hypothetical protein